LLEPVTGVLLVGCGRMGGSLLKGWRKAGVIDHAIIVDPALPDLSGETVVSSLTELAVPLPNTILLAVKPQMLDTVMPALSERLPDGALVISIAAGKTIGYFADRLPASAAIVRAMPNTPAAVGRGFTVCCAAPRVTDDQRAAVDALMRAVGEVAWIDDESLMHAVTAVSGSGPAYVFHLIEALETAAIAAGLPPELAARLARATITGSGELALRSPDAPSKLRADVTSPGGTTAAALAVLMGETGLTDLMTRAVAAATARSVTLARE
jgi:pyrroline-5-carboxylate reductase